MTKNGKELLTSQFFVKGEAQNNRDGIFRGLRDPKVRDSVTLDFAPLSGSKLGELTARGDIVLRLHAARSLSRPGNDPSP